MPPISNRNAVILAVPISLLAVVGLLVRQPTLGSLRVEGAGGAEPERLRRHVEQLAGPLVPRDAEHVKNLDRAAAYLTKELRATGARVREEEYRFEELDSRNRPIARGPFRNVIARFGPEGPERVLVGAHYDAYGPFPGADDNASGIAGLLELARLLGTGDFIAVVGSLADAPLTRRVKRALRGASGLPVYSINAPSALPGIDFSDHRNYWKLGYPAVMISDTAFYRNKRYHTPNDTPDTLDYRRMAQVVDGVHVAVLSFKP